MFPHSVAMMKVLNPCASVNYKLLYKIDKLLFVLYLEVVKQLFVLVLCCKAGVTKIPLNMSPLLKPSIVEITQLFCYDEWNNGVSEAFLKHDKPAHSSVTILKRICDQCNGSG